MRNTQISIARLWRNTMLIVVTIVLVVSQNQQVYASLASPMIGSQIFSSGYDVVGKLGNGVEDFVSTPSLYPLPDGLSVQKIVQTQANILVLASDNQVYGSGRNANGELGVGNREPQLAPVKFELPGTLTAVDVASYIEDGTNTEDAVFVLASDGNVYGAGSNYYGILGYGGPAETRSTAVRYELPVGVSAVGIYPQKRTMLVIGSDGNVYGTGQNSLGELGAGIIGRQSSPVVFGLPMGVSAVSIATQTSIVDNIVSVVADDGNVYSAGNNWYGKFGNGTDTHSSVPVEFQLPIGVNAASAWAHGGFISVITTDGDLYTSGNNSTGSLGNGTDIDSFVPVRFGLPAGVTVNTYIPNPSSWSQSVIASDGGLYTAGDNSEGTVGDGTTDDALTPTRFQLPVGVSALEVSISESTLVRASDGSAYISGTNYYGQMGTGPGTMGNTYPTPLRYDTPVGQIVTDIEQSDTHNGFVTYAVAGGQVYGAGDNYGASLGIGSLDEVDTPTVMALPPGVLADRVQVIFHDLTTITCVITTDNQMYCAGRNIYGQFGIEGTVTFEADPQQFILPEGVYAAKMLSVYDNLFVLGSDGQVYGSGANNHGQLGNGTTTFAHTPVRFELPGGLTAIDIVRTGLTNISVLASDGQVYSSGLNSSGMLGAGVTGLQSSPVRFQLPAGLTATSIAPPQIGSGVTPIVVFASDGNAYAAGTNNYGQVGSGSLSTTVSVPERVALPVGVNAVSGVTDNYGTYILGSDDNVYGAGRNNRGQLGNGSTLLQRSPVRFQLPGALLATGVFNDRESTFVLASDGQLYGAGINTYGHLGDGSTLQRSTPVRFQLPAGLTIDNIYDVNGYQQRSMQVLASDGNVYSAGNNTVNDYSYTPFARFGNGTVNASQSTPVRFEMPVGVTVTELVKGLMPINTVVLGSDGSIYAAGVNLSGFGGGAPYASSLPVRMVLPAGEIVTSARNEYSATFAVTASGKLFAAGCNSYTIASEPYITDCPGWLGTGDYQATTTGPAEFAMPGSLRVAGIDVQSRETLSVLTTPSYAAGGQVYCDVDDNGVFDSGEEALNAQTVALYQSVAGSPTGPAIATFSTESFDTNDGVYFFDGLAQGTYVLGLLSGPSVIYSSEFILDGNGDGWLLGDSNFISSGASLGQRVFVCGASTTPDDGDTTSTDTDGPSPAPTPIPTSETELTRTGMSVVLAVLIATVMIAVSSYQLRRFVVGRR